MRCQKLFEKGCIGGVEIRNRVAMTAMGNGLASWDGEVSLELIRFYEDRAKRRLRPDFHGIYSDG